MHFSAFSPYSYTFLRSVPTFVLGRTLAMQPHQEFTVTTLTCVMQGGDRSALCPLHVIFKHVIHVGNPSTNGYVEHLVVQVTAKPHSFGPNVAI